MNDDERHDLLEWDVDVRLLRVWEVAFECAEESGGLFDLETLGSMIRAAYARGYTDALLEPRGKLMKENGYPVPAAPRRRSA